MSHLEDALLFQIRAVKLPAPEREYVFAKPRKWRFDLAWPERKLAVEVEGGTWVNGRHSRGAGMRKDCEKYATATLGGWHVFRFTGDMVTDGSALGFVEAAFALRHASGGE